MKILRTKGSIPTLIHFSFKIIIENTQYAKYFGVSLDATINKMAPHHLCHRIHIVVKQRILNQKQISCWGPDLSRHLLGSRCLPHVYLLYHIIMLFDKCI